MPHEPSYFISSPGRLLFLHVPKTAGLSMRLYLRNQYPADEVFAPDSWRAALLHPHPLAQYRLYQGHFRANFRARLPSGTRTLVILRRPQDRLISALRHLRRDPEFHPDHHLAKGRSLPDLIGDDYIMRRQRDVQTYWLAASASADAVDRYLRANPGGDPANVEPDMDDTALGLAERMLQSIAFIGFTENLAPVLAELSDEMDYFPIRALPRINAADEPLLDRDRLTRDDLARVAAYNTRDEALYATAHALVEARRVGKALGRFRDKGHHHPPEQLFTVDLRRAVPGVGWYECEEDGGAAWRWTGPGQEFTLGLALRVDRSYNVEIVFRRHPQAISDTFEVRANGVRVAASFLNPGGDPLVRRACFCVPVDLTRAFGGACHLVFDTGPPSSPAENGHSDARPLGIAVYRIAFAEAAPADATR